MIELALISKKLFFLFLSFFSVGDFFSRKGTKRKATQDDLTDMRSLFHITWHETKDAMFPSSKWTVISNFWFSLDEEGRAGGGERRKGERQIYLLYSGFHFSIFFLFCFLKICHLSTTLSCLNCNRKLLPRVDLLRESFVRSNPSFGFLPWDFEFSNCRSRKFFFMSKGKKIPDGVVVYHGVVCKKNRRIQKRFQISNIDSKLIPFDL